MWQGDISPNIWTGGDKSSQVVFICWFPGILFYQNAYSTLMLTKELRLQFLGTSFPRHRTRALTLDHAGGLPSPRPAALSPNHGNRLTPVIFNTKLAICEKTRYHSKCRNSRQRANFMISVNFANYVDRPLLSEDNGYLQKGFNERSPISVVTGLDVT